MADFLMVPQWQGSPAARALLLVDGATAIGGDLPAAHTRWIEVPVEAGDALGTGVLRLSALRQIRTLMEQQYLPGALLIGGDCGIAAEALSLIDLTDTALVWCDAHPDLHTPESSPSGAFAGMALWAILGEGDMPLALSPGLAMDRVVMVGTRQVDDGERERFDTLRQVSARSLRSRESIATAVRETSARKAWIHIDVDVIDPAFLGGVFSASPFGADPTQLADALREVREQFEVIGASICGFAPRSPGDAVSDLGVILRLIGALV